MVSKFNKNDFESSFNNLVRSSLDEYGNLELSAKQFFREEAKHGYLVEYVKEKKLPVDLELSNGLDNVIKLISDNLDKKLEDSFIKRNKGSIVSFISNLSINYIDERINNNKSFEYKIPFKERVANLIQAFTVDGYVDSSVTDFMKKYSVSSSVNVDVSEKDIYNNILDSAKERTKSFINKIFDDFKI
ncbi:hypothetical protein K9L67_00740 [Candidatus Woesearchaeota archaeon]|nr:hypothetical protein [Candidatus Woesearchaeota archaeon]MCF7900734.1 hypothetical protein [Candidatus Woesearchaeota archaeon]MCF8013255.1 hypothetical protein [Candidatus Woesearchaeota archaeon]